MHVQISTRMDQIFIWEWGVSSTSLTYFRFFPFARANFGIVGKGDATALILEGGKL